MIVAPFVITVCCFLLFVFNVGNVASVQYIDLSYNYDETTLFWPGEAKYEMDVLNNGTVDGCWYQREKIATATHVGTHLDAPCHFAKGVWSVEQIPLSHLMSEGVMVDVSQKTSNNSDYQVSVEDLEQWEKRHGELPNGVILLIRTGWARYWSDPPKYFGTNSTNDTTLLLFPGVSSEAAEWIATNRNISGIGLDVLSVDYGRSKEFKTHQILAAKNIFNLENVADMSQLNATGFMLHVLPMKLKGASGAPCRIVAEIPYERCSNNSGFVQQYSFILFLAVLGLFIIRPRS